MSTAAVTISSNPIQLSTGGKPLPMTWQWTCGCHGWKSAPWPERPTDANAQAEHDLVHTHWPTERYGGRKAPKPHELP